MAGNVRHPITTVRRCQELWAAGDITVPQLAELLGVAQPTVRRWIDPAFHDRVLASNRRTRRAHRRVPGMHLTWQRADKIIRCVAAGMSYQDTARAMAVLECFSVSSETVSKLIETHAPEHKAKLRGNVFGRDVDPSAFRDRGARRGRPRKAAA